MFDLFTILFSGLIYANHGGKIIDYLLKQLRDASVDVSFFYKGPIF